MFKSVTYALAAIAVSAQRWTRGFPPRTNNCATPQATYALAGNAVQQYDKLPWGLERDTGTGGCRCASEDAEWGPGNLSTPDWRCHCVNKHHYEERINVGASLANWDLNNKKCGACQRCVNESVAALRLLWTGERQRIENQKVNAKEYLEDQLIPWQEVSRVKHTKELRSRQNRARARVALEIIGAGYTKVKMSYIGGDLGKAGMADAHKKAAAAVAGVRAQWQTRQDQIDASWDLVLARQKSQEEFTLSDKYLGDEHFESQLKVISDRYGKRIAAVQNTQQLTWVNGPVGVVNDVCPVGGAALTRVQCPLLDV